MIKTDLPIPVYKNLSRCLTVETEISDRAAIRAAMKVELWANKLLNGQITDEQFLEAVEPLIGTPNMDQYINEIYLNLTRTTLERWFGRT